MGALHQGHLALVSKAVRECSHVVVSIFINPRQFNNLQDLAKYPRQISEDLKLLENSGAHAVYLPDIDEVYANSSSIALDLSPLDDVFEGHYRPNHFQGVIDVVYSLFDTVQPSDVYFGLKDLQQCMVVEKLIASHFPTIQQHNCETLREVSGLAMSSRNARLSEHGKSAAANIYVELNRIAHSADSADSSINQAIINLKDAGIETEYLNLVDLPQMETAHNLDINKRQAIVFAGYLEGVRLIDNLLLNSRPI